MFDTHAHYDDEKFDGERDTLLTSLFSGRVKYILNAGTDLETSRASIALSEKYPGIYCAVGIHPHEASKAGDMTSALDAVAVLAKNKKAVAIGEVGLDYYYDFTDREEQKKWFSAQLALARELDLPVIVHDRDAHGDCLDAVKSTPGVRGVFHSYSGSTETAAELVSLGWYISFSGSITFKKADRLRSVVPTVPDDKILIETDCPYLSPEPYRGKINNSDYMFKTAERAAELRGVSTEQFIALTEANAKKFFNITE